jgi:hypothetical protein
MEIPHLPAEWLRALLSLYYETDDGTICSVGNGVIVATNGDSALLLTAAHVADEVNRVAAARSNFIDLVSAREANASFASRVSGMLGERHCDGQQDVVSIGRAWLPPDRDSDIALALAKPREGGSYGFNERFGLKLIPPEAGERVFVIGTHGAELRDVTVAGRHEFEIEVQCVPGTVITGAREGESLAKGPVFDVNIDFPPGLSGSPVFVIRDDAPLVCGVVSSSFAESGSGSVAAIWPALALMAATGESSWTSIFQLVRDGTIGSYMSEIDRFTITADGLLVFDPTT